MPFGYYGSYLRIDASVGAFEHLPLSDAVLRHFIGGSGLGGFYDALGALPGVESIGKIAGIPLVPLDKKGRPDLNSSPLPNAAVDDHTMISIQRPKIIAGRAPNPAASDEALVDPLGARLLQVHVGSVVPMFLFRRIVRPDGNAQKSMTAPENRGRPNVAKRGNASVVMGYP